MRLHTVAAIVAALFLASCVFGHTVALRLLLLGTGLVLTAVLISQRREPISALPSIWLPFFVWGAWALLSLAWSIEPARTWKEWQNEVFYAFAGLWVCYVAAQARLAGRIFVLVLGAAAALACAIALYEFSRGLERYALGWHGGPGNHSSALLTLTPCVALAGWYASRGRVWWIVWLSAAMIALLFASAYTTLNRTIWLGMTAEFLLLGFLVLARRPASSRWLMRAAVVVAIVGCGAVLASIQAERRAVGAGGVLEQDSRLLLLPQVIEHMRERPLLGYGFGRGLLRDPLQAELAHRDTNLWHAHNLFLDYVLQVGVLGLALFGWLLAVIVREAWRRARDPDDWTAACGMALAAVVAGMLVRNMTDTLLVRQNALLYWGVCGALLGLTARKPA